MAINTFEVSPLSQKFVPINLVNAVKRKGSGSTTPGSSKKTKEKKKCSPYLRQENVQMISCVTEKTVHKKNEIYSSFPLATNIYRANSAEFKSVKHTKKNKKPALLNDSSPKPPLNGCAVSDMSNSEYVDHKINEKAKAKKRMPNKVRKYARSGKIFDIFDRDARYVLNASGTDLAGKKHGDTKADQEAEKDDYSAQDVWEVLRNINRFHFNRSSPQHSDDTLRVSRRRRNKKKPSKVNWIEPQVTNRRYSNVRKGRRFIETFRTEEMTVVANIEIDRGETSKTTLTDNSSFDRVTVINNKKYANEAEIDTANNKSVNKITVQTKTKPQAIDNGILRTGEKAKINTSKPVIMTNRKTNADLKDKSKIPVYAKKQPNRLQGGLQPNVFPQQKEISANLYRSTLSPPNDEHKTTFLTNTDLLESRALAPDGISFRSKDSSNCFRNEYEPLCTLKNKPHNIDNRKAIDKKGIICNTIQSRNKHISQVLEPSNERTTRDPIRTVNRNINNRAQEQVPKRRLVTTMPSISMMQKMTVGEIKRKLNQLKFPIVIQNNNQLSSTIEVLDMDPPQFYGLDQHIWPYMSNWNKKNVNKYEKKRLNKIERFANNLQNLREDNMKFMKGKLNEISKNRTEIRTMHGDELKQSSAVSPAINIKSKTIRQIKDKVLSIWQRRPLPPEEVGNVENIVEKKDVDMIDNTPKSPEEIFKVRNDSFNHLKSGNMAVAVRQPWSKAKKASDLIENVMSKLIKGVYYKNEYPSIEEYHSDEVAQQQELDKKYATQEIQVLDDSTSTPCQTDEDAVEKTSPDCNLSEAEAEAEAYVPIPGFDEPLPELQIESIDTNQIAVRNHLMNVTLQFDITLPSYDFSSSTSTSTSTISRSTPLLGDYGKTKIYKCNTTLMNAVLPAELCTMLPAVMKTMLDLTCRSNVSDGGMRSVINFDSLDEITIDSNLYSIRPSIESSPILNNGNIQRLEEKIGLRLHRCDAMVSQTPWFASHTIPVCPPFIISPELIKMLPGRYVTRARSLRHRSVIAPRFEHLRKVEIKSSELPQPTLVVQVLMYAVVDPRQFVLPLKNSADIYEPTPLEEEDSSKAYCLQEYRAKESEYKISRYADSDFISMLKNIWNYRRCNIHFYLPRFTSNIQSEGSTNTTGLLPIKNQISAVTIVEISTRSPDDYQLDSLNLANTKEIIPVKPIYNTGVKIQEKIKTFNDLANNFCKERIAVSPRSKSKRATFKIRYDKLHQKSKSTSHVVTPDKTPLQKIANTDDFMQALGSARCLAEVFEGIDKQKLMMCVAEMKKWVKEITSRQALLVLMLLSKSDTPNLVQQRSLVLQGIALRRITRAKELEMEVAVLEKETLKVTQHNLMPRGIFSSKPNIDQDLLEELCWIAKNTASDYQRPFDESIVEMFIRGLLEKRKNMNPSYLRVMARYVGLGLLKGQTIS